MSPYPTANIPNGYQILGGALTDASKQFSEFDDRQQKMRLLLQEMAQKRAAAILAERAAEDKRRMDEFEYTQKKDQADRELKMREFAKGDEVAPSYKPEAAPARARRPQQASPVADLEVDDQGRSLPSQGVEGDSSWDMLNDAADASIADAPRPRRERTPEEFLQYGMETGTMDEAKKYADATKALREKPMDAFNDPSLMADYKIRAQDPAFQQIAEGYAVNPQKYGPILQNWAIQHGYAGQRWWATELRGMTHQMPPQPHTPAFNPQAARQQKFSQEQALNADYTAGTKNFSTALPAFAKAQQALQRNNPADAYSAVINFVRTLDPQSTVREAEERLARMSAAGDIVSRWFGAVRQKLVGTLSDEMRQNLYEASKGLLQAEFENSYTQTRNDVRQQTLNYPDPTGQGGSLDTLNTIGRGRDAKYNELMGRDIFAPQAAPAAPAPAAPRPHASTHPDADKIRKIAEKILANPKSKATDIAKAKEALKRLEEP